MSKLIGKTIIMGIALIMCSGIFSGCSSKMKITDFEGLKDLPSNPDKILFLTNLLNFDEQDMVYGKQLEYAVPTGKISEVMEKLFAVEYEAAPKNIAIDPSPIENTLIVFNGEKNWTVNLGLRRHNGRWYKATQAEGLIELLYTFT